MNRYRVSYQEDFFTTIKEIEIVCSENDIKKLADEYYEENKERLKDTVGVNWVIIDE